MYRIEWQDDTIDALQKLDGAWKAITIIPVNQAKFMGQLIDQQLKK